MPNPPRPWKPGDKIPVRVPPRPPGCTARVDHRAEAAKVERHRWLCRAPWRKFRLSVLAESPLCVDCRAAGDPRPASHVHHVVPREIDPGRAYDPDNVVALCAACHRARENRTAPRDR